MDNSKLNLSDVLEILTRLANDAMQLGALQVTIKTQSPDRYEFSAAERLYQGYIHPQIATQLVPLLQPHPRLTLTCRHPFIASICLASHTALGETCLTLSWDLGSQSSDSENNAKRERPDEAKESAAIEIEQVVPEQQGEIILLVEDDVRFASLLKSILIDKGWRVELATSAAAAQERLKSTALKTPSLMICDVHMPQMDGVALVAALRAEAHNIPILMLTSDDNRLLEVELALLGVNAFVRKQDDPRVLIAWIKNLLSRQHRFIPTHSNGHPVHLEAADDSKSSVCS